MQWRETGDRGRVCSGERNRRSEFVPHFGACRCVQFLACSFQILPAFSKSVKGGSRVSLAVHLGHGARVLLIGFTKMTYNQHLKT